jgi:hypothetical protein
MSELEPFVTVAVSWVVWPVSSFRLAAVSVTETTGGVAVMVTAAVPDFVGSRVETAETVTIAGLGTAFGAKYRPVVSMVPIVVLPPGVLFTCQVTEFVGAPVTVALN